MLYVLYAIPGNALLGVAATEAELPPAPANSVTKALPEWADVPPAPYVWNAALANFAIPQATGRLTRLEFRWRYTLAEQVALQLAETNHPDATVRATLAILRLSLAEASEIDVADPRTIQGVQFHASIGLIAPARVAEILAAP